ncbi:MAG: decaprenyl-phosphate phosphoribosyltransferase [Bacteroidota bacterium]
MIQHILISMRLPQWIKNFFLFAAILFAGHLGNINDILLVLKGFFIFSITSSGVYLLNDIADAKNDRIHPVKKYRPIASGELSALNALLAALVLFGIGISFAFYLHTQFAGICLLYISLNILYSNYTKHFVILDVMSIATGFVLRVVAGAMLINVPTSVWLLICTFLLSLFLGFVKRRHEITTLNMSAENHRKVLEQYSVPFLDQMVGIVTACTVIAYSLYTISEETVRKFQTTHLIYTIPFVLFGIFRYLYLVHKQDFGGNPTKVIFSDYQLFLNIVLWILASVYIIYIH